MVVVADASVAIRADLDQFKSDLAGAKTQAVTLGAELRKALSFGPLAAQGPDALVAGLDRARAEADDVTASIHKLIAAGKLPAEDARRYADILDEIGIEADQTTSELKQLRAADPSFDTPAIKAAADQIDRVGDEAKGTAAELNAMKGVRADTQMERLAQQAKEGAKGLDATSKSAGGLIGKLNSVKGALVGLGVFIGAQQIVAGLRNFFGDAIESATNFQTATRGVQTVLGDASGTVIAFGKTSAESFGLSKREVAEFGAVLGGQLKAAGFDLRDAATETVKLEQKAADLAATFGGTTSDAVTAIGALLRGERDTIEKYGVSIKQVDVNARIASLGLDTSTAAALKNATAVASLSLLYEQTSASQGAFAANADTNAVIQAKAAARIENAMVKLGDALLPLVAGITEFTADVLPPLIDGMLTAGGIFGDTADIVIPALVLALGVQLIPKVLAASVAFDTLAFSANAAKIAMFGLPGVIFAAERATHDLAEEWSGLKLPDQSIFSTWLDGAATVAHDFSAKFGGALVDGFDANGAPIQQAAARNFRTISDEMRAARLAAVEEARAIPGDVANALISGQADIESGMKTLTDLMNDEWTDATRIAYLKGVLASEQLAEGLASKDADVRGTAKTIKDNALLELEKLESGAYDTAVDAGTNVETALNDTRAAAVTAAAAFAKGVKDSLIFDSGPGGVAIGEAWVNGINTGINNKKTSLWLATGKIKGLLGGSLPTEGPLQHPDTGGYSIGEAWAKAIAPGIYSGLGDINNSLARWAQGLSLGSMAVPLMATGAGGAGGGGSVAGNVTNNYSTLNVMGKEPVVSTAAEIAEQAARLGRFKR